jgi:hypothetical protein
VRNPTAIRLSPIITPGQALWNQRENISAAIRRIRSLSDAIGTQHDFSLYQWIGISAFALEFRPDLILELGRLTGNSTCCFLEVASRLGSAIACKLISFCLSDEWFKSTLPRIETLVPREWFAPGDMRQCDILDQDLSSELRAAKRCLIFWDAHGFEIAEWVLGKTLPCLTSIPHIVVMHDLSDLRYTPEMRVYGEKRLWQGRNNSQDAYFCLGHVISNVGQAISVVDFSTRNGLPLHSADESFQMELANDPNKAAVLRELLGADLFARPASWFWFTLNEAPGEVTFPRFKRGPRDTSSQNHSLDSWRTVRQRLVPQGTYRRKLYDTFIRPLLRSS